MLESYHLHGNDTELSTPCWRFVREIKANSSIQIPQRLFHEFTMTESDSNELTISIDNNHILLKKSEHGKTHLSIAADNSKHTRFQKIISQTKIERNHQDFQFWMYADSSSPRLIRGSISGGGN